MIKNQRSLRTPLFPFLREIRRLSPYAMINNFRDTRTLWQDLAKTIPATSVGNPVARAVNILMPNMPELVLNGDFSQDSVWTRGTGWSIGSGVATKVAGSASTIFQPITVDTRYGYEIAVTVTRSAGTITPRFETSGGVASGAGTAISTSGSFIQIIRPTAGAVRISFSADAFFAGSIDNVSVKLLVDWVQPTAGNRPTVASTGINFVGGSSQFLSTFGSHIGNTSCFASASERFSCLVTSTKFSNTATGTIISRGGATQWRILYNNSGVIDQPVFQNRNVDTSLGVTFGNTNLCASSQAWNGTSGIYNVNQNVGNLGIGTSADDTTQNFCLGTRNNGGGFFYNGVIHNCVIIDQAMTATQLSNLVRWGLIT